MKDAGMTAAQKDLRELVREHFSIRPDIAGVYLFGSLLGNSFNRTSDIDIGVLYLEEHIPNWEQVTQERQVLSDVLQREADLVILNDASPILCYQVLKLGQRIIENDPQELNQFFVRTINDYFDLKQTRRVIEQSLRQVRML